MKFLSTSLFIVAAVLTAMLAASSLSGRDRMIEFSTQPFRAERTEASASDENPLSVARGESGPQAGVEGCEGNKISLGEMEARLVELHNEERVSRNLPSLCVRDELTASARTHSEDMISRDYFAHESPEDENAFERMKRSGYTLDGYSSIKTGENLAWRTHSGPRPEPTDAELVVEGWLDSEGHRRNLLDPEFREVGIGAATGKYKDHEQLATMYTVNFGVRK